MQGASGPAQHVLLQRLRARGPRKGSSGRLLRHFMPQVPFDSRTTHCIACTQAIIFLPTQRGTRMPCDAATVALADVAYDHKRHKSHFATCPNAKDFRKKT